MLLFSLYALSFLASLAIALPTPQNGSLAPEQDDYPFCQDYCAGTVYSDPTYVCGDPRLGPVYLPTQLPMSFGISDIVNPYNRFGGLCPGPFLTTWTNASTGAYIYPPQFGFQLDVNGKPVMSLITLEVGAFLDRFGSEYGNFFSPIYAPYIQRSLPPSNLDTPDQSLPYNYHVYTVIKAFDVLSGPIAGWFGQPGQGVQYQTFLNVQFLIGGGFLARVNATELLS